MDPNEKGLISICFVKDPYFPIKLPEQALEKFYNEYMKIMNIETTKKSDDKINASRKEETKKISNFKLLKRQDMPPKPTEKTKKSTMPVQSDLIFQKIELPEPEIDPETKKKLYEETRAKLFSEEDIKSCDLAEKEGSDNEKIIEQPKNEEKYDWDYDRYLPIFISQQNQIEAQTMPPEYYMHPRINQTNYYQAPGYTQNPEGIYYPPQPYYPQTYPINNQQAEYYRPYYPPSQ